MKSRMSRGVQVRCCESVLAGNRAAAGASGDLPEAWWAVVSADGETDDGELIVATQCDHADQPGDEQTSHEKGQGEPYSSLTS